jgi:FixJ family two-component response regulator
VSESDAPAGTHALVCIVADDISIRESLSSLFRSAGLNVEIFPSAEEFLTNAHFEALGCVIVDVLLPGITGLDLQQGLAAREIEVPIIFLFGYDDNPIAFGAKPGAVECLTKPLADDYLLETVWSATRSYIGGQLIQERNAQLDRGATGLKSARCGLVESAAKRRLTVV